MYTLQVSHSMLHMLAAALDIATALRDREDDFARELVGHFQGFAKNREVQLLTVRKALMLAHVEAVKVDGHGDELDSDAPPVGPDLAELEAKAARWAQAYDDKIMVATVIEKTRGPSDN